MDRETGELVSGRAVNAAGGAEHTAVVKELHSLLFVEVWEHQQSLQSVAMLGWAGFLASGTGSTTTGAVASFAEADSADQVVKKAVEGRAFKTMVDVLLKYLPDRQHDALVYAVFERNLELLLLTYASKLMIDVPTVADKAALAAMQTETSGEVSAWTGDCLEDIIEFATALCAQHPRFARSFWHAPTDEFHPLAGGANEGDHSDDDGDGSSDRNSRTLSCYAFLVACRDAAFKNPACLAAYLRLVATAARGGRECAQHAFHHIKQNPAQLSWDHFFDVMAKYQRLLLEAEKPLLGAMSPIGTPMDASAAGRSSAVPGPRFIRPKELEALEAIQRVIQAVIDDSQLALLFFHNHDWAPISTFVAFLQSRIPSSLKGALMKTLAGFARVPELAPFVWREVDALQILRTTGDTSGYGPQDLAYELEHYESLSRSYPATRGFVTLLRELFASPQAWTAFEGDGRVAAIQFYFEFLVERVFLKFDLRKYEREEEKWALASGTLAIFKKILRSASAAASAGDASASTAEGSLAYQLLARFLSSSPLLDKLLDIVAGDGGVENLENASTDLHLEHAFFYCLDIVKRETEAKHGSLNFVIDIAKRPSDTYLTKTHAIAALRERSVQHALEILVLVLEADAPFVTADLTRHTTRRLQVERLHAILTRHRSAFVSIVQYVKFSKSPRIPHLSAAILRLISERMAGHELVDLLVDSGAATDVTTGYMNQLLNAVDDEFSFPTKPESSESDEMPPAPDSDVSELDISVSRARTARHRKARDEAGIVSLLGSPDHDDLDEEESPRSSIRSAILDLVLENLAKPAPNVSHLLLGVLDNSSSDGSAGQLSSVLDAVLALVSTAEFGLETPDLARRSYKLLHLTLTQDFSSTPAVAALEREDFFAAQLALFAGVYRVGGRRRRTGADIVAALDMRGWFLKSLAVYLHMGLHREPPNMKAMNRIMSKLLSTGTGIAGTGQHEMMLLQLLDETSFHLTPPRVPTNEHVVALAEQSTTAVGHDVYKWLRIDVERFLAALQALDVASSGTAFLSSKRLRAGTTTSVSPSGEQSEIEQFLAWAVQWNVFSERIAAESHALNSLRELVEVVVVDYLALPDAEEGGATPAMWQGLDAVGSSEVRLELSSGIVTAALAKITERGGVAAQLVEIVAQLALLVLSPRGSGASPPAERFARQDAALVELILTAIASSAGATGNPAAARNSRSLLYSSLVNVLHRADRGSDESDEVVALRFPVAPPAVVDLMCRDASDGDDPLGMALALAALETLVAADTSSSASLLALCRERGYLLHFIGVFSKLIEMDAIAMARGGPGASSTIKSSAALPPGVDAATLSTIYECCLSFFTRVAGARDGAAALVEGGLLRILTDARNLPTHRPKPHLVPGMIKTNAPSFQRLAAVYARKWLPVLRLVTACCAALPQHRTLATQVLGLIGRHSKLLSSALKTVDDPAAARHMDLTLLRELAYVTFVLRYVTPFADLCTQALPAPKWDKLAQLILRALMLIGKALVPRDDDVGDDDRMIDDDEPQTVNWWRKTAPRTSSEVREAAIDRGLTCPECEDKLNDAAISSSAGGLLHLSLFDEEKLYTSRMIACNAAAFCASRMTAGVGRPLLAATPKPRGATSGFPSLAAGTVDPRAFAAATDPLWARAPTMSEAAALFDVTVDSLQSSKQLLDSLVEVASEAESPAQGKPKHRCAAAAHVRHVVEYHVDSAAFVAENLLVTLLLHFRHYLESAPTAEDASALQPTLVKVLTVANDLEVWSRLSI